MAIVNKDWWQGKYGPLLIAEIGGNHEGNFQKAKKLLILCSKLGVDVVKFQIYQGANLINRDISPKKFEHFKKFELTKKQHIFLANEAKRLGMKYSSSVWTKKDLSWIAPKMDYFKIGSGDLTTYEIIDEICKYEKPIIISTGLSKLQEVNDTIKFIKSRKKFYKKSCNLAILQCTSTYPTKTSEVNLDVISKFKKKN